MYYWNTRALVSDLTSNSLSEKDQAIYCFAPLFFSIFMCYSFWDIPFPGCCLEMPLLAKIRPFFIFLVSLISLSSLFRLNHNGDNKNFLSRFFALAFLLLIKMNIIVNFLTFGTPFLLQAIGKQSDTEAYQNLLSIIYMASSVFFYWRMSFWLKQVSQQSIEDRAEALNRSI